MYRSFVWTIYHRAPAKRTKRSTRHNRAWRPERERVEVERREGVGRGGRVR